LIVSCFSLLGAGGLKKWTRELQQNRLGSSCAIRKTNFLRTHTLPKFGQINCVILIGKGRRDVTELEQYGRTPEIQSQLNADIAPLGAHYGGPLITWIRAERVMAKVSNPILSLLAATLLLFGISLSLQSARANETDSARADTCIVAHSDSAPKGQHWYVRTERQKGLKCWYLQTGGPLVHHAAARPRAKAATRATSTAATHKKSAARPRAKAATRATSTAATHKKSAAGEVTAPAPPLMNTEPAFEAAPAVATVAAEAGPPATAAVPGADAPPPAGPTDGVQPQPHVEILRTVPVGVPTQEAAQPSAPAVQVAPATQGGSTTAVTNGTSMDNADAVVSGSDVKNAASAVHEADPDAERSGSDAAQQKPAEAPGLADTIATIQPTEIFFLLAIGLSMVVFLIAIASRIAAKRREPIITDYPDSAWSNDRFDPLQVDDTQFADEAMDEQWIDEEQDVPFIEPEALDDLNEQDWIEQRPSARTNRNKSLASSSAAPSEPDAKGLEPVLRILRQA
jgi:hypothetical protein